jgi:calcineurin-like phosphoesterase family protein
MNIFFTSDHHHRHINISGPKLTKWNSGYRNFESLEEMSDTIINNLNSMAKYGDKVYLLGDVIMGSNPEYHLPVIMNKINCKDITLIYGNHDKVIRKNVHLQQLFNGCYDYLEVRINKQLFVLCHYAFGVWNEMGRGSINCYAHSHNNYTRNIGRQIDVGVDTNGFYPYHIDEIIEKMNKIEPTYIDHHTKSTSYN